MRLRIVLTLLIGLFGTLALAQPTAQGDAHVVSDVRVLIDMSGSMKKNDPDNLRIPALRLLTQLLPDGSHSGVWTFGQYVNMLVPKAEVNQAWKDQAYQAAGKINSSGLFTNIESALNKSTWDWKQADPHADRSLIFLTDGLVDISKNPAENAAARQRVLEQTLPRLKAAGVKVNTVGLSDEADTAFLQQLAAITGGWHQDVRSAEQLERIFLRMFEKSVPADTLPLVDNKVRVDASVKELTMLVFRSEEGKDSEIVLPSGERISHDNAPENVRWRREARYDLVTVDFPPTGEWQIDAEVDPDNRVMVVTNLRVRASKLPNVMLRGDSQDYFVSLLQDRKVITQGLFLDLVNIDLTRTQDDAEPMRLMVRDDGFGRDIEQHDGKFSAEVMIDVPAGEYQYHLTIDGGTFQRAGRQVVQVVDGPVAVSAKQLNENDPAHFSLSLVPYAEVIDPDSLIINAKVSKNGGGDELAVDIPRVGPTEWRFDMNVKAGDQFQVAVSVEAKKLNGDVVSADLGSYTLGRGMAGKQAPPEPIVLPEPVVIDVPEEVVEPEPEPEPSPESDQDQHDEDHADTEADHHAEEETNWLWVALKLLGFNGVLIGAGVFVWWKWFKKPKISDEGEEAQKND